MKLIFLTSLIDPNDIQNVILNCKRPFSFASQNLQEKILKGLVENKVNVRVINTLMVGMFPTSYKKAVLVSKEWKHSGIDCYQVGGINIQPIKESQRETRLFNRLKMEIDNSNEEVVVLAYDLAPVFVNALNKLKKKRQFSLFYYVPDLPMLNTLTNMNHVYRKLSNNRFKNIKENLKSADGFVLITEYMKNIDLFEEKPTLIIEGMIGDLTEVQQSKNIQSIDMPNDNSVVYAGSLHREYGIMNLINSFVKVKNNKYQLHIYGSGDCKEEIVKIAEQQENIIFHGLISSDMIPSILENATLLVNPRTNLEKFSNYSFPSKIHDYMISGKPILLYRLGGIPHEYNEYLNFIDGQNDDFSMDLEKCLKNIDQVTEKALLGKQYVITNKNCEVQTRKIIEFIGGVYRGENHQSH